MATTDLAPQAPPLLARLARWAARWAGPLVLLAAAAVGAARSEAFLTPENLFNVLRQNAAVGLMTLGMLLAMLAGGIDLSSGAMLAVGGVVAAALSPHGAAVALPGAAAAAGLLGLVNGWLIGYARIQPFIATLAMNMAARGMLLHWAGEEAVRVASGRGVLKWLGRGWLGPVPVPAVVLLAAFALAAFALRYTRFGRHLQAAGDNAEAARLMGLDVGRVALGTYAASAALAGLGGALLAGRVGVGQAMAGLGWELTAIAAVVVGTTFASSGRPGVFPALAGLLLMALLFNLLSLEASLSSYWQWVLRGAFLLAVVIIQAQARRVG